jgi:hypothetical protein
MKLLPSLLLAVATLSGLGAAHAADLAGKWTSEFDSQIGPQKYAYEFKAAGATLTGKATFQNSMASGDVDLKDIKLNGGDVSFAEPLDMGGMSVVITYVGTIAGDEMKLTRTVGDFGVEQIVVKRLTTEAKADAKPEAKPAPAPAK